MLSQKQKAVAIDLATGVTQRAAATKNGVHYMTITLWKRRVEFTNEINRLQNLFQKVAKGKSQTQAKNSDQL